MTTNVLGIADGRALGSSLRVVVTEPDSLLAARSAVDEVLRAIDAAASRFRPDSELGLVNARPDQLIKVSPLLARAVAAALRGAELTSGAVDPTVGSAVRLSGYDADFASVALQGAAMHLVAERVPGWRAVRFSEPARTIMIPRGVELDLGATGKAFAADLAASAAAKAISEGGVLVSLGGDIAVAGDVPPGGWLIQVSEDSAAAISDDEETISILSGGVATSGTIVRRWIRGDALLHHIIDPATGAPVNSCWRTVTVAAGNCVDANIASTAAIVMREGAIAWLEGQSVPARLVGQDGIVHRVAGWPAAAGRARRALPQSGSQPALTVL